MSMSVELTPAGAAFSELRRLMFSIAYRMTGSVSDAEDIAQEAFIRFEQERQNGTDVESPRSWLSTVTTRLAIDHLRSARVQRESYIGPWLPEPLLTDAEPGPAEHAEVAHTMSQAFLVMLETLSPSERAVFLLREVFGFDYPEIADAVGKSEQNCRQIATRARRHVDARRPRFDTDADHRQELFDRFVAASEKGDVEGLKELLAADVVLYSDGGGKVTAARKPIAGQERVARLMRAVAGKRARVGGYREERVTVNGQPGRITFGPDGRAADILTVDVLDGKIQTVRVIRNPDKLPKRFS
jgi:RNA polymerase sigma-70 factor (ECF subfamily)